MRFQVSGFRFQESWIAGRGCGLRDTGYGPFDLGYGIAEWRAEGRVWSVK